jgi:hypothetical protein
MTFIEITGQPCAGKSSLIAQEVMIGEEIHIFAQLSCDSPKKSIIQLERCKSIYLSVSVIFAFNSSDIIK